MRKVFAVALILVMLFSVVSVASADGNVKYLSGVTREMTTGTYWIQMAPNADEVLLSFDEIEAINSAIVTAGENTNVVDIETVTPPVPSTIEKYDRELYLDGELIDEPKVISDMMDNIEVMPETLYAVTVRRTNVKAWPIVGFLGYDKPNDPDDETQLSILEINSPVITRAKCTYNDHVFYFCQTEYISGWIDSESLAICKDEEEWKSSWKVELGAADFIVVTQDKIVLEPMLFEPEISEVELMLGSRLKLVPEDEMPANVGEREGTLYNYVVYIPTRDADGMYVRKIALIQERYKVSVGFLPFTQENLTNVAFELLGNRYGWGGMLDSYDSSLFHRQVYSCFGLRIPTNSTWQKAVPGKTIDLSEKSEEEKLEIVKGLPLGAILYMPGFSMQYIGCIDDMPYVICSAGVFSDSDGEVEVHRYYTVSVMPLSVRRKNGTTFLSNLSCVLNLALK